MFMELEKEEEGAEKAEGKIEGKKKKGRKKEKPYNFKIEIIKLVIIVFIIIFSSIAIYYFFFRVPICSDEKCFSHELIKCNKVRWVNDDKDATWLYSIEGKTKDSEKESYVCAVSVKLLQAKKGKQDLGKAEGKEMICFLPLGVLTAPEQNLESCTGELKEELQDLVIKRMHAYILENLEDINKNIKNFTSPI